MSSPTTESAGSADPRELQTFVQEIRKEREELIRALEDRHHQQRIVSAEAHAVPGDAVDAARAEGEVARLEGMTERLAQRVDALGRVLERAAQGRLAVCDRCGGAIPLARLRARSDAELCLECARQQEQEEATS
jgi:RNA polymerase-binding transcription factor DksA